MAQNVIGIGADAMANLLQQVGNSTRNQQMNAESFGFFLDEYVIEGAEITFDERNHRKINISEAIVSFQEGLWRVLGGSVQIRGTARTYFVDFTLKTGFIVNDSHPVSDPYLPLWEINTDQNGEVISTVDVRGPVGYIRFRAEIQGIITDHLIVDNSRITDGAVSTKKLSNFSVSEEKISNEAVTTEKIKNRSITTEKLSDGIVTRGKLAPKAISTEKLDDGVVTTEKIGQSAIIEDHIVDYQITREKLANDAVSERAILKDAVTEEKIKDQSITEEKMKGTFGEKIVRMDYPTAQLAQRQLLLEQQTKEGEVLAARGGFSSLSARLDSLDPGLVRKRETFIAEEGQMIFQLTKGSYSLHEQKLSVTVGGVPQFAGENFTELSATSFETPPLKSGTIVVATWYEGNVSLYSGHGRGHVKGGSDEINIVDLAGLDKISTCIHAHNPVIKGKNLQPLIADGLYDNAKRIQNMIDTLAQAGGGTIYIPRGTYRAKKFYVRENVEIIGESRVYTVLMPLPSSEKGFITSEHDGPASRIGIANLSIVGIGSTNPRQNGIHLEATEQSIPDYTGGTWYSEIDRVYIKGFDGHAIYFRAIDGRGDLANQFLTLTNVVAFRGNNTYSRALCALGQLGQVTAINAQLDASPGPASNGTGKEPGTNVQLGRDPLATGAEADIAPSCVNFITCTIQGSEYGVKIDRCENVNFFGGWFENLSYVAEIKTAASSITFTNNRFANAGYDGKGTGFAIYVDNSSVVVTGNHFAGKCDWAVWGENHNGIITKGNTGNFKTRGITRQLSMNPDGSLNTMYHRDILLSGSKTVDLKNITARIMPGETFTIRAWVNHVRIVNTGNISLPRPLTLRHGEVATFGISDVGKGITLISTNAANISSPSIDVEPVIYSKFYLGERVDHSYPSVGSPVGWVCTREGYAHWSNSKASTVNGSNQITVNNNWSWAVGDNIAGVGIPVGTKIIGIDTTNKIFTLSNACTATGNNIAIYDAILSPYGMIQ